MNLEILYINLYAINNIVLITQVIKILKLHQPYIKYVILSIFFLLKLLKCLNIFKQLLGEITIKSKFINDIKTDHLID